LLQYCGSYPYAHHDPYLPSTPASLQALGRVEYATTYAVAPPDSRIATPLILTFFSQCLLDAESVLFIGTQFSNLYTAVDTPAMGRVVVCLVFVCLVFVCKYVLGHSRVSQPLNLRLYLLRHLGFLTSPHASPTCRRRRLNSYRLLRRSTPGPPPILWAHLLHLPASPRPSLYAKN
jgi:hypothetical protein